MSAEGSRLVRKTCIAAAVVVLSNVAGNASLSRGLHGHGPAPGAGPLAYLAAFLNPWVVAGVCLLILWMLSRMALLSWADLSYVLPVTASGYVLTAVAGHVLLGEHLSAARWAGTALIVAGVALVGATNPLTKERKP
jgi:drug/metabolite transporter (DMT)-like permease